MIGSAQKAPVTSAALTALNLAVVRQVVFEHAAEQISKQRKNATEAVVQTAEKNRDRNAVVGHVIENKKSNLSGGKQQSSGNGTSGEESGSRDFIAAADKKVDIQV